MRRRRRALRSARRGAQECRWIQRSHAEEPRRNQARRHQRARQTDSNTNERSAERLENDELGKFAATSSEGHSNANLLCPLCHCVRGDAVHSERGNR
jgi:hypothetical protein